jgi:ferredoxin
MTIKMVSHADLAALVAELVAANTQVIAPVQAKENPAATDYKQIQKLEDATLGLLPRRSIKEFLFPQTEVFLRYKQHKGDVTLEDIPLAPPKQVIIGAKPCDVASTDILDKVMNWDYRDELWFAHREATTIVSLLCPGLDNNCFCTAVGAGPDSTSGSDAMLIPVDGGYLAEIVTEKGKALFGARAKDVTDKNLLAKVEELRQEARKKVEQNLPVVPAEMPEWLAANFANAYWDTLALRCHGCGACTFVCPTCHCFEIADERENVEGGVRRRNWDACQTGKFTVHTSGHNPRNTQKERFRQRVMHKFSIYPQRFGEVLCTGCGRCARVCPGGMSIQEAVCQLMEIAGAEPQGNGQ